MKLLIIDDEVIIRDGMSTVIKWEENGIRLLQPAASAEEALMRIPVEMPDIIMTDIRMTGKSGLELVHEVKRDFPNIEIVILSGYEEFTYVQQAMRDGVSDYLLKSSRPGDIMAAAMRAQKRIMAKRTALQEGKAHERAFRSKLLERMLRSDQLLQNKDIKEMLLYYPELRMASPCETLELWLLTAAGALPSMTESAQSAIAAVGNKLRNSLVCVILEWDDGWLVIFRAGQPGSLRMLRSAFDQMKGALNCELLASSGSAAASVDELRQSLRTAEYAATYRYLADESGIIKYEDVKDRRGMRIVCSQEEEMILTSVLRSGDTEKLSAWVADTLSHIKCDPDSTPRSMKAYLHSFLVAGFRWLERAAASVGQSVQELPELKKLDMTRLAANPAEVMLEIMSMIMKQYERLSGGRNEAIERTLSYIREHLDQSLTLSQVAAYVHMNPNYFSELFKKETGKNYIEYVTEARIEWATRLLRETPAKISEIAKRVGYEDVKHFNRLFKRYSGDTPSVFRNRESKTNR